MVSVPVDDNNCAPIEKELAAVVPDSSAHSTEPILEKAGSAREVAANTGNFGVRGLEFLQIVSERPIAYVVQRNHWRLWKIFSSYRQTALQMARHSPTDAVSLHRQLDFAQHQ